MSDDCISRQAALDAIDRWCMGEGDEGIYTIVENLPPITPQPKTGHCKDCKYFEYDSIARIDGIPLIVAHEFCSRWGDGCKTKEDGYCFLYDPQESEEE